jgi:hypothetical protein
MSSSAVVTLKLTSEQFLTLHSEVEALIQTLTDEQQELQVGCNEWQDAAQRIMALESLLRNVL